MTCPQRPGIPWGTGVPYPGQIELTSLHIHCMPPGICPFCMVELVKASQLMGGSFFQLNQMLSTYETFLQANVLKFM